MKLQDILDRAERWRLGLAAVHFFFFLVNVGMVLTLRPKPGAGVALAFYAGQTLIGLANFGRAAYLFMGPYLRSYPVCSACGVRLDYSVNSSYRHPSVCCNCFGH